MSSLMAFGVYVHIPYCLQRCTYCDFATYERSKIFPSPEYIHVLASEIAQRAGYFGGRPLDTLYFGGGTPSLLPASEIISVIGTLEKHGYPLKPDAEVTIEINPATVDRDKLAAYLDAGINRFSVGAQTFDDVLLKMVRREHSSRQTRETLELLASRGVNFSFDLLFALPTQTLAGVREDLTIAVDMGSKHVSPYCLTVPEGHVLSTGRAPEGEQVEMFDLIRETLTGRGFDAYEISNFARPGFESRHNLLYWTDHEYWGVGLSAHSYSRHSPWGTRFWNPSAIGEYRAQIESSVGHLYDSPDRHLPENQYERLEMRQALTDFCHTSLRLTKGLERGRLRERFSEKIVAETCRRLGLLRENSLIEEDSEGFRLTRKGTVLSNRVFAELTFLPGEIEGPLH